MRANRRARDVCGRCVAVPAPQPNIEKPMPMACASLKPAIGEVRFGGATTHHRQAHLRIGPRCQEILGIRLLFGAGRCHGIARDRPTRVNSGQDSADTQRRKQVVLTRPASDQPSRAADHQTTILSGQ